MLEEAGFEVVADEVLTLALDPPLDARARQFAHRHLAGRPLAARGHADAADLAALDVLIDEGDGTSILRRPDAVLHATRQFLVGRAPSPG